jgi:pyrimidine-specific ribonucleoside hydrolase
MFSMRARVCPVVAVILLSASLIAACGGDSQADSARSGSDDDPRLVVVDTAGGSDDAMALLYLLQHPGVEVAAITVTGAGLVHCPLGASNVAGVVELAAPDSDIPIACGSGSPLEGDRAFPDEWRAQADSRYGGILPAGAEGAAQSNGADAVELLTATIEAADRPVTILTLGPLTNVAAALDANPELVDHIDRVVVMGGAFEVPGNVFLDSMPAASIAEWNIYADPVAAEQLLQSGVKMTFVPLDTQVPVDAYVIRDIGLAAHTPPATTVAELLGSDPFFASGQFFMWDPLAAASVAEPELFTTREEAMSIQSGGRRAGWTSLGGSAVGEIATVIDGDDFLSAYMATLDARTSKVSVSRVPDASIVTEGGCAVSPSEVNTGPSVLALESPSSSTAAAIGLIDPTRTDADIEAFFASAPTGPPSWFELAAVLPTNDSQANEALVDLRAGDLTVICVSLEGTAVKVSGRATLTAIER